MRASTGTPRVRNTAKPADTTKRLAAQPAALSSMPEGMVPPRISRKFLRIHKKTAVFSRRRSHEDRFKPVALTLRTPDGRLAGTNDLPSTTVFR